MQGKRLVIDANILVRAVLGVRVRQLIERYCESAAFYVAESNLEEAMQYLAELAPRRGIREEVWRESLTGTRILDCSRYSNRIGGAGGCACLHPPSAGSIRQDAR